MVGLATRWVALLSAINMLVAIVKVGIPMKGFTRGSEAGYEFDVALLANALALLALGGGAYSLDRLFGL